MGTKEYDKLRHKLEHHGHKISEPLWDEVLTNTKLVSIKKNGVLADYGSRIQSSHFIVSGSFVKSIITLEGEKKAFWFHLDDVFSMATCGDSYFLNETTKYEIKALEDSTVISIKKSDMDKWVLKYPTFNQFYITDLVKDFMAINELRAFALVHSPEQIFHYIAEKYPSIPVRVSSKNMAHFLGVSPEWYSKLKKRMGGLN